MAYNKIEANSKTLIDLTSDTVTADTLLSGRTAHLASGVQVTGTFEPVTGVKGNAESTYRKGNVNLTPANIGAATSAQGTKADSAVQTIQIGGTTQTKTSGTVNLPAYPTKSSLGLGNVDNTSDANKPISTAAQAEFDSLQKQIDKALIPQGDSNIVRVDGGLNFETTDQTTLEVTDSNVVIESNKTKASGGEVNTYIIVNDRGHTGEYGFTPDGLKAYIPIAPDEDSLVSVFTLVPQADINHNGIFRGENLTSAWVENGKIKESLYTKVHSGNFSGLYLGDYFTVSITTDIYTRFTGSSFVSGTTYYTLGGEYPNWDYTATTDTAPTGGKAYFTKQTVTENVDLMIAAFNYYYNVGDTALTSHHLVLIPRGYGFATKAKMNSSNTTVGSYFNSDMHQTTLPCYAKSLKTALNNHLLSHRTLLSNTVNTSTPSMAGAGLTGASTNWAWVTTELQLMTEQQVYGTRAWTSSAYDIGIDYRILPVFNFINPVLFGRDYFWLRSVVSSMYFAVCNIGGHAGINIASGAYYVRPLIVFG